MTDTVDTSGVSASWKDVANAGTTPRIDATLVTGADTTGNKYWRSEIVLRSAAQIGGPKPDYVQMQAGDTIDVDFSLRTSGFEALPYEASTTVFQLHGPTRAGAWLGPPFTVSVRGGSLRFGGGYLAPRADGTTRTDLGATITPYSPGTDGVWRHIRATVHIAGPGDGWATVWVDDQLVTSQWAPPAGTWYTQSDPANPHQHQYLYAKAGCYGYSNTAAPTVPLLVEHRGLRIAKERAGSTTTYTPAGTR